MRSRIGTIEQFAQGDWQKNSADEIASAVFDPSNTVVLDDAELTQLPLPHWYKLEVSVAGAGTSWDAPALRWLSRAFGVTPVQSGRVTDPYLHWHAEWRGRTEKLDLHAKFGSEFGTLAKLSRGDWDWIVVSAEFPLCDLFNYGGKEWFHRFLRHVQGELRRPDLASIVRIGYEAHVALRFPRPS
ncbi:MAG: hypothetical protein HYW37_01345 [Candidatus Colwellbacteria bacterium]|nr:hypothetical protein [Candidatus Colwellbacteria bacterium]